MTPVHPGGPRRTPRTTTVGCRQYDGCDGSRVYPFPVSGGRVVVVGDEVGLKSRTEVKRSTVLSGMVLRVRDTRGRDVKDQDHTSVSIRL